MSLPKVEDARQLSDEQLVAEILAVKKQLVELRLQKATGRLEKPHLIRHQKHRLAQLMTVETERNLDVNQKKLAKRTRRRNRYPSKQTAAQ
jgi:large subunit ribosomal protein L29